MDNFEEIAAQIKQKIDSSQRILLHTHVGADLDSIGSALGLKHILEQMGKQTTVVSTEPLDNEFIQLTEYIPGVKDIIITKFNELNISSYDLLISTDSETPYRIDRFNPPVFPLPIPTIVIDHHPHNTKFGDINFLNTVNTCTSEIIYWLSKQLNYAISPSAAVCLYCGIVSDTGRFMYPTTTSTSAYAAAADLIKIGSIDFSKLIWKLTALSNKSISIIGDIQSHLTPYFGGKVLVSIISQSDLNRWGVNINEISNEITSITHTISYSKDAYIGALLKENLNFTKVSLRCNHQEHFYDVSVLAKNMGNGGGHTRAAGVDLKMSLSDAEKLLLQTIQQTYPDLGQP